MEAKNNTSALREVFESHPDQKELYIDTQGIIWISKTTAESQSKGEKITIVKRTEIFKHKNEKE